MSKQYNDLAIDIVKHVGGEDNVASLIHCITRLRFYLKDSSKADTAYLSNHDGIVSVVQAAGQYQVVIGNHVGEVYDAILETTSIKGAGGIDLDEGDIDLPKGSFLDRFIALMSGLFQPLLAVLSGAGVLKGLAAILVAMGLAKTSGFYMILNATGDGFFQFLPIALAVTSARKFKSSEFIAIAIAGAMLYPTLVNPVNAKPLMTLFKGTMFESPVYMTFAGIPVILQSYYSTVVPVIVAVFFGSRLERFFKKVVPDTIKLAIVPALTLLVAVPAAILVIGPLSNWASDIVGGAISAIIAFNQTFAYAIVGAFWQIFVMFGLHWGLVPIMFNNYATQGFDTVVVGAFGASFAQIGVVLAIILKTKEKKVKRLGWPAFVTGIFGITEPAIYGITLPMKTPFIISCIAAGLSGALAGFLKLVSYTAGGLGVFKFPTFFDPNGANTMNVWNAVIVSIFALLAGFVMMLFVKVPSLSKVEKATSDAEKPMVKDDTINSPLSGEVISLDAVSDPVFASGDMGQGIAIKPSLGEVVAPADATVNLVFPTKHAVGLVTDNGSEILIHVGMDTVELDGEHFTAHVASGDHVKAGQPLLSFDPEAILAAGYSLVTPVIVTNTSDYELVSPQATGHISKNDLLITVKK